MLLWIIYLDQSLGRTMVVNVKWEYDLGLCVCVCLCA